MNELEKLERLSEIELLQARGLNIAIQSIVKAMNSRRYACNIRVGLKSSYSIIGRTRIGAMIKASRWLKDMGEYPLRSYDWNLSEVVR